MRLIPIGKVPDRLADGGTPVYFPELGTFGVIIIGATTRYGKSLISKIIYSQIQERHIIIFDYMGEHSKSRYPNLLEAREIPPKGVSDLFEITNLGFKIQDFYDESHWYSSEFPEGSARLLADLAKLSQVHKNNFNTFLDMIQDLPTSARYLQRFTDLWGITLRSPVHPMIKQGILSRLPLYQGFFCSDEEIKSEKRTYVEDWEAFFRQHKHVSFNLHLTPSGIDIAKGQAYVGLILEQMARHDYEFLKELKPLIVIEEADILCPNLLGSMREPSSLQWLRNYVLKLQKYHVELFFIVQDFARLDMAITSNYHFFILGRMESQYNPFKEETQKLHWDNFHNYREFLFIQKGYWRHTIFVPYICPVQY